MQKFKIGRVKNGISILGVLVLGAVLLMVLSYFHISVRGVVESPTGADNIGYVKDTTVSFWDKYLKNPATYLWKDVWVNIFWKHFINTMENIRDGKPTVLDKAAESIQVKY